MATTFLNDIDENTVETLMKETDENVKYFTDVSTKTASKYCEHLDALMQSLYKRVIAIDSMTNDELERNVLELTNLVYFMGDKVETLGIYDDMSGAAAKEVYNKAYLDVKLNADGKKPTVAELTANAEQSAQYESVVNNIYERAYKMVKFKIDAANKMVDVLRKVISRRMQEQAMISRTPTEE